MPVFDSQIVFIYVEDLERSAKFYGETLELPLSLDQGGCRVYQTAEKSHIGICTHRKPEARDGAIITLVVDDVDGWFEKLKSRNVDLQSRPVFNEKYLIYHFFFHDPDGYLLEIQRFENPSWKD